ncbi:MAG: hypothetical protein DRJ15_15795 [Bacteroidetes bacterium]|nr:MAG: hypothetical protein DRJ15_15795 [Bacteroidota bacterium]
MNQCKYGKCIVRITPTITTTCPFINRYKAIVLEDNTIGFFNLGGKHTSDNCLNKTQKYAETRKMRLEIEKYRKENNIKASGLKNEI